MVFVELRYLPFYVVVFVIYWTLRSNTKRKIWLLGASYFFYASWNWKFLSLLVGSTLLDYVLGKRIASARSLERKRLLVTISIIANLGILGAFKYYNFFAGSFADLAGALGLHVRPAVLRIVLPVGISFYTFQSLSYTIDLYRERITPAKNLLDFAVAVAFFPHLVAGPIMRARDYLSQLDASRSFASVDVRWALVLFLTGFFKKACISDNLSPFVDAYFRDPSAHGTAAAWLATMMYTVQIYCDFSGYTDMAIASAGLLGYRLAENFDAPYLATDVADFWRRWHISLSSWLRDYLYIPLGGNRSGPSKANRNLMITMLLGGLWHGASWNFILWGFMHGVALVVHRIWRGRVAAGWARPSRALAVAGWLLTFFWVSVAWVPFRAPDFGSCGHVLKSMFSLPASVSIHEMNTRTMCGWWLALLSLGICHYGIRRGVVGEWWRRPPRIAFAVLYGVAWSVAIAAKPVGYVPFIYFQF